jgi:autotransporter-associated beta strand protein
MAGWLFVAGVLPAQAQTLTTMRLSGSLGVSYNGVSDTYNAGYTMYVGLLGRPQYAYYLPNFEASLEIGTWMGSTCNPGIYCDIEGGPGVGGGYGNHWCNHGFGIGAVAGNGFTNFANGVSSGRGVGVYGAAQISPRLLYPPRMEMFRNGSKGQMVGYGYLALPLLPGKATTDGVNVPTGDHWWTLFFNTRNFQGPVAVLTPHFYSEVTKANPGTAGKMLDSCWAGPNKSIANESHTVPGREYDGPEGSFFRVPPVFSAINHGTNGSIALASPTVYNQTALWNAAQQWFNNNGPAPVGPFNAQGAALQTITGGRFGWKVQNSPLGALPLAISNSMGFYAPDPATYAYQWGTNQVSYTQFADGTPAVVMPEFYQLQAGKWTPVSAAAVPAQLASVTFDSGAPPAPIATYTVPNDPVWTNPGPAAGPFQARIEDGNVVTYYWFRFADQPAIMKAGLTSAEREQLQANVVKIHSAWTNGGTYLGPPTMGTLADVDPALLVTPPPGLEVGYVPVASNQFWGGWVTPTWNQATSGNWSVASNWGSTNAPEAGGHSYYRLTFSPPASCVATNDLSNGYGYGGFAANQLNFSGAVTLTGNPISLTADVESYPQINQNSVNAVVINTPLKLDVSTTLGGTGSGLVVISNVISGPWHSLTINSPATWRICGLTPNTYSGGTIIKRGTLIWGASPNGTSPDCSYALGSGPVTLNSGATLQFEKASPTNALTLNGGTLYAANSAGVTWMGPVTLNSNTTARTDYGMGISGNVSGAGSLTKTGTNTLTLSGVNTYTGANVMQAGTLSCSAPASLSAGALSISNGAGVNLNYSGTRNIFSLALGGTNMLAGVYGSSNSPATYQDAHFSGTGTVTVPVPISIANLPAAVTATNQATLNASLGLNLAYGGTNATVLVYWGTVHGGTNPAAWANSARVGAWTNVVSTNIAYTATGLAMNTNTTYYFGFLATNAVYSVWATNVLSFTTPTKLAFTSVPVYPPARYPFRVTVQAQDANGNPQTVTSATTVQLSQSSGSGTLSGTVSGTMANGSSSVVISGLVYSAADTMTLTATASSGMSLTAAVSPPITFMPPDLTWDANGTGTGVVDGGGAWIATTNTWWNGTTNVSWADNFNARIGSGGAGGTITLGGVTANRVTFTNFTGTYTLSSGTLTVVSNLTVANSAGTVVLYSAIGGTGGVTMNSPGNVQFKYFLNTYSGGTVINAGTVSFPIGGDGSVTPFFGTGPITINTNGTLNCNRTVLTNSITLNGGTVSGGNSFPSIFSGPVTLAGVSTINFSGGFQINGNVSGSGGLRSVGSSSWHLNGNNAYAGPTTIVAGTISFDKSVSVAPGPLSIANGAVANLNYSGTRTIAALTLGGTNMSPGVYGSSSSSATYKDSHFSGTGTVTVNNLNEPPSP